MLVEITNENVDEVFKYHVPKPDQIPKFNEITEGAKAFAKVILANVPRCPQRTRVLNAIVDARMAANAAIALEDVA